MYNSRCKICHTRLASSLTSAEISWPRRWYFHSLKWPRAHQQPLFARAFTNEINKPPPPQHQLYSTRLCVCVVCLLMVSDAFFYFVYECVPSCRVEQDFGLCAKLGQTNKFQSAGKWRHAMRSARQGSRLIWFFCGFLFSTNTHTHGCLEGIIRKTRSNFLLCLFNWIYFRL